MVTQVVHHTQRFIFRKASKHKFVLMSVWSGNLEEIDSNVHRMSVFDQVMLHRSNNHKAWPLWPDSNRHKSTTLSVNCGRDRFAAGDLFRKLNTIHASHVTVFRGTLLFKGCDLAATAGLRNPVHVTDVYATESRTPLVRELSADRFSVGLLLHCSPPSRVRAGEWAKVCGGQAPLWSAASAEKQRIFFLFRLQPTRHRYSLAHSTAHMSSGQSTKWHQTQ